MENSMINEPDPMLNGFEPDSDECGRELTLEDACTYFGQVAVVAALVDEAGKSYYDVASFVLDHPEYCIGHLWHFGSGPHSLCKRCCKHGWPCRNPRCLNVVPEDAQGNPVEYCSDRCKDEAAPPSNPHDEYEPQEEPF